MSPTRARTVTRCGRLGGALVALGLAGCGGSGSAPATATFPVLPRASVIASASGGSQVNRQNDRNLYRYLAVSGAPGVSGSRLIADQAQWLTGRGWAQERSVGFSAGVNSPQPVPVTARGAEVLLNAPGHHAYAAMSVLANSTVARLQTDGTPLAGSPAIAAALAGHRPVLWVVLGNGSHP